jgi:5-methylcytosine-specific restriction endonuclease McrA
VTKKVRRIRNGGTWTESQFFSAIRSALRQKFRYWKPITKARDAARRVYKGKNKRQKWEYQCAHCQKWYKGGEVQVDHIIPCGSLRSYEDLVGFIKRLTPEDSEAFQVLCVECHKIKTKEERNK